MFGQLRHTSHSRRHNDHASPALDTSRLTPNPMAWLRDMLDDSISPPSHRPAAPGDGNDFPHLQPSLGDDVFGTPGNHPAITGRYSLPRRKGISRAQYMGMSRRATQDYFPISPRLEHRIEARTSRKSRIAEAAESQKQAAALVRKQTRLRRQREHHLESARDLERRIEEGEVARRAIDSQQSQVPGSLHRLAQDQVDFEFQDRTERVAPEDHFERTRNLPPVDVRHQLKNAFHFEREAVARFDGPRRIARLKGAELHVSRLVSRHNHRYGVIDSECAACLQSIER